MDGQGDALTFLPQLLAGYRQGRFTEAEVVGYCLEVADGRTALRITCALSPELLGQLAQRLEEAPTTEAGWAGLRLAYFGAVGGASRPAKPPGQAATRFRSAVESLRAAVGRCAASQASPDAPCGSSDQADDRASTGPPQVWADEE